MASSLPHDVGSRESKHSKPDKARLSNLTADDAVKASSSFASDGPLSGRKRATTTNALTPGSLLDRRSTIQGPVSLPHLKVQTDPSASFQNWDYSPPTQSVRKPPSVIQHPPTLPIDIPIRKKQPSRPTTPLTGRERRSFFPHTLTDSRTPPTNPNLKGATPSPDSQSQSSPSQSSQSEQEPFATSPINPRSMRNHRGGALPGYTPTSPLSPTRQARAIPPQQETPRRLSKHLDIRHSTPLTIPSLPPYHPANYESQKGSPQTSRPSSSSYGHQLSDAQKKLQRHQRELVVNATRTVDHSSAMTPMRRPSSPRLDPLSSPGPITPLALEEQTDYFLGGPNARTSAVKGNERRDMAERLIGIERDRIRHPDSAERHSPAVSPAA
ncbi:MAG: hypothetical protein LQ350_001689 [Teloschistes chrysophthalmus]|nr:MAG: hypothetical protein LQ350_001689 [Niorma chrysophthalma]